MYEATLATQKLRDEYGVYHILATMDENGDEIEYLHYDFNSKQLKLLGGSFSLRCADKGLQRWYRNDYMAMHALTKFCEEANKAKSIIEMYQ